MIGVVVGLIIFVSLLPVVITTLGDVEVSGIAGTLLELLPLFLALGAALAVIAWGIKPIQGKLGAYTQSIKTRWNIAYSAAQQKMSMETSGRFDISAMVGAIIVLVVGIVLFPVVHSQLSGIVAENAAGENLSTVTKTMLTTIIPIFYVLALVFVSIGWALRSVDEL